MEHKAWQFWMIKTDAGTTPTLQASDLGSTASWGSKSFGNFYYPRLLKGVVTASQSNKPQANKPLAPVKFVTDMEWMSFQTTTS